MKSSRFSLFYLINELREYIGTNEKGMKEPIEG